MKAVDYFNKYGSLIMSEAVKGEADSAIQMFSEVYNEINDICKSRNAARDSAAISAVKEVNQKWNKICRLITETYSVCPLKRDAVQVQFLKQFPQCESMFTQNRGHGFKPEEAKEKFNSMSQAEKLLITLGMLGAYASEKGSN